jgi:hypothetical protein
MPKEILPKSSHKTFFAKAMESQPKMQNKSHAHNVRLLPRMTAN